MDPAYRSCTVPDTVTTTLVLPASTGTGASAMDDLASMAIMRGRGMPWSLELTDTSRSVNPPKPKPRASSAALALKRSMASACASPSTLAPGAGVVTFR